MKTEEQDRLLLKWGTLKGWHAVSPGFQKLLKEYHEDGVQMSVMVQKDTPRQKELILAMIDACNGKITNDWTGEEYQDKNEAKKYILEYGK